MIRIIIAAIYSMTLVISCGEEPAKPARPISEVNVEGLDSDRETELLAVASASPIPLPLAPMSRPDLIKIRG
jgi:hypothetical protein